MNLSLRKRIAHIIIAIFFILAAIWTYGQVADEIGRKYFFNTFNILIALFPFIATFLYFRIFNLSAAHTLILQNEKRKAIERCYVIVLALPLVSLALLPFALGLSILLLPIVIPMSMVAMFTAWMVMIRDEITTKKGVAIVVLSVLVGFIMGTAMIRLNKIFERSDKGYSPQSEEALSNPSIQQKQWTVDNTIDTPLWKSQVLGRFVEPTYDDALINNVLVLNDVVEQYWKKNSKLPAHSEELTVFVPSLIPRYNNVSEKSQKIGWFYGILYRKMTEREYELCGKFKNTPSDIDSFGSWQYISGLHCLQRKL